jgi:hypothetical protein
MAKPKDWGSPPSHAIASPRAADVNGDGFDDLVYHAPCGETTCWLAQVSTASSFRDPVQIGRTFRAELGWSEFFDWNGDGRADVVSIESNHGDHRIQLRLMEATSLDLGPSITVAKYDGPVSEVLLKRPREGYPVEALVSASCDKGASCIERLVAVGTTLISPGDHERLMTFTRSTIWRCEFEFVIGFAGCHNPTRELEATTEMPDNDATPPPPFL